MQVLPGVSLSVAEIWASTMMANETSIACWEPGASPPAFRPTEIAALIHRVRQPLHIIHEETAGWVGLGCEGRIRTEEAAGSVSPYRILASLPPLDPEWLGDPDFQQTHKVRFAYVTGSNPTARFAFSPYLGRARSRTASRPRLSSRLGNRMGGAA